MSDLQSLLKKLTTTAVSTMSYVYYNKENGKIHKISSRNIPEEGFTVFEVENEEVLPILSGERRTDEFKIEYDISAKQIRLKEVAYDDIRSSPTSSMCYQLPIIKEATDLDEGYLSVTSVYEGMEIYIWSKQKSYKKNQCVWYNNNVYKLSKPIRKNVKFNSSAHRIFVEDVALSTMPTQTHVAEKLVIVEEYVGVHVDVWYKELPHQAGQHVWLNEIVYKLLKDQAADTEFTMDNAEIIISNVQLYADENKSLKTISRVSPGDIILNNNSIYSIQIVKQEFKKDKRSVFFYTTPQTLLYHNGINCIEAKLNTIDEEFEIVDIKLNLTDIQDLPNGQKILCGNQLYETQPGKQYDITIQQDTVSNVWSLHINSDTKKFLQNSGYKPPETFYFSVTSKYDPNILHRSLKFTLSDLLDAKTSVIPFISDSEKDSTDVSIYTAKYFDSYAHEIY